MDFKKAKGSSDARESDHIERKVIPDNADPTRTHLNRELVKMPSGVYGRDEAIAHRIKTAGIKRKITNDQVRVIRTMLSGTHEDMMNIAANGQLDDWCNDSLKWLQDTFGKENVVSVVLHMDEHTPHLHASIVPIVIGERRKARSKPTEEGKRTYRKKANAVRLCADDVLNRDKMIGYHDSYAEAMSKYGLKRGVRGSDARHTTTAQYYRNIKRETERLQNCMKLLQYDIEEAQRLLQQTKSEISTEKLQAAKMEESSRIKKYENLFEFGETFITDNRQILLFREYLTYDLYLRENVKNRPSFALPSESEKSAVHDILHKESENHEIFPELSACNYRELTKTLHVEVFEHIFEKPSAVLFCYQRRDPVTGNCVVHNEMLGRFC